MSNPQANERTALSEGPARYDATPAVVEPMGTSATPNRGRHLSRLTMAVISLSATFLIAVLLSSTVRIASTPDDSASEDLAAVASTTGANQTSRPDKITPRDKIIPSMQPFSTINPADAHCPHMDRPEVQAE